MYVLYIYLHLVDLNGFHVGKYTIPMDTMGELTSHGSPLGKAMLHVNRLLESALHACRFASG